eukprot:gnl/Dysnectes_brevis/8557_a15297_216.p1 GENE.gnl/Dysnectes_brevis/8557_a15297_216~~gnl/Dysnectes_brevis/8557_a15297_216.p1  ORF type:complete len:873 (-),score=73.54 gnl/Dysnectes_brevis/8557_a15297_216:57-2675(-)
MSVPLKSGVVQANVHLGDRGRKLINRFADISSFFSNLTLHLLNPRDDQDKIKICGVIGAPGTGKSSFCASSYFSFFDKQDRPNHKPNVLLRAAESVKSKIKNHFSRQVDSITDKRLTELSQTALSVLLYLFLSDRVVSIDSGARVKDVGVLGREIVADKRKRNATAWESVDWGLGKLTLESIKSEVQEAMDNGDFARMQEIIAQAGDPLTQIDYIARNFPTQDRHPEITSDETCRTLELMWRLLGLDTGARPSPAADAIVLQALLSLVEELGLPLPPALPLLLHVDEVVGEEAGLYELMARLMRARIAVCYLSGLKDVDLKRTLNSSKMHLVSYRLSPLIRPQHMYEMLQHAPEMRKASEPEKMIPFDRTIALSKMVSSGGNPRVLVCMMKHYARTMGEGVGGLGIWTTDLGELDLSYQAVAQSPELTRLSMCALPLLPDDKVEFNDMRRVKMRESTPRDLEFDDHVMMTNFSVPPHKYERHCHGLTLYGHMVMPIHTGPAGPEGRESVRNKLASLIREHVGKLLKPKKVSITSESSINTDTDRGKCFEKLVYYVLVERLSIWADRVVSQETVKKPSGESRCTEICRRKGAEDHACNVPIPLVRLFGPVGIRQPAAKVEELGTCDGDSFWGTAFPDLAVLKLPAQHSVLELNYTPYVGPQLLTGYAKSFMGREPVDISTLKPGVYLNAPGAPGPDILIITADWKIIAIDVKLGDRNPITLCDQYIKAALCLPPPDLLVSIHNVPSDSKLAQSVSKYTGTLDTSSDGLTMVRVRKGKPMTLVERRRMIAKEWESKLKSKTMKERKKNKLSLDHEPFPELFDAVSKLSDALWSIPHVVLGSGVLGPVLAALNKDEFEPRGKPDVFIEPLDDTET